MSEEVPSIWLGICIGVLVGLSFSLVYLVVLQEPGSAFYPFAVFVFLAGPLVGGIVARLKTREHWRKAFFTSSSAIFVTMFLLFIFSYLIFPLFERTSVQLPSYCDGYNGSFTPSSDLSYSLPNIGTGILLSSNAQSVVVVMIDYKHSPFPSTLYLINKSDNKIIRSMGFKNDIVSAMIQDDTLYIYNDKLGYILDARTGEFVKNFLSFDNFGGLSQSDRPIISSAVSEKLYLETTAVISSWRVDGTVVPHAHITFNGIALGCFISGETNEVTEL